MHQGTNISNLLNRRRNIINIPHICNAKYLSILLKLFCVLVSCMSLFLVQSDRLWFLLLILWLLRDWLLRMWKSFLSEEQSQACALLSLHFLTNISYTLQLCQFQKQNRHEKPGFNGNNGAKLFHIYISVCSFHKSSPKALLRSMGRWAMSHNRSGSGVVH